MRSRNRWWRVTGWTALLLGATGWLSPAQASAPPGIAPQSSEYQSPEHQNTASQKTVPQNTASQKTAPQSFTLRSLAVNADPVCASYLNAVNQRLLPHSRQSLPTGLKVEPAFEQDTEVAPFSIQPSLRVKWWHDYPKVEGWQWLEWIPVPYIRQRFSEYDLRQVLLRPDAPEPYASQLVLAVEQLNWLNSERNYYWLPAEEARRVATSAQPVDVLLEGVDGLEPLWDSYQLTALSGYKIDYEGISPLAFNLFRFQEALYQLRNDETVYKVAAEPAKVCQLAALELPGMPALKSFHRLAQQSFITEGDYFDQGLHGYPWRARLRPFLPLLFAPEELADSGPLVLKADLHRCEGGQCPTEETVEQWLAFYGQQDAWSARELLNLRQHMQLAAAELSQFYRDAHQQDVATASRISNRVLAYYLMELISSAAVPAQQPELALAAEHHDYPLDHWAQLSASQQQALLAGRNRFGKNALMLAAHFNDYDAVLLLLKQNIDLTEKTAQEGQYGHGHMKARTALLYAAENASPEVIALLWRAQPPEGAQQTAVSQALAANPTLKLRQWQQLPLAELAAKATDLAATFPCDNVSRRHEQLLCQSAGLRLYDRELNLRYKALQQTSMAAALKTDQRQWLKQLWQSCPAATDQAQLACYKQQYRGRIRLMDYLLESLTPVKPTKYPAF